MNKIKLEQYEGGSSSEFYQDSDSNRQESGFANNGKWTDEENIKYTVFIEYFQKKINSQVKRRTNKVFKHMAKFIPSRNAIQCRSHHQKMERRFKNVSGILKHFKGMCNQEDYLKNYQELIKKNDSFRKPLQNPDGVKIPTFKEVSIQVNIEELAPRQNRCPNCQKNIASISPFSEAYRSMNEAEYHNWYSGYPYMPYPMHMPPPYI